MSHHEGVSCDACLKSNFRGKRYKCLICFDYDLCATCHDSGALTGQHTNEHPMQCILTRNDLDLYFAGELIDQPHSFTCPYCGKLGFTDTSLYEHVNTSHNVSSTEVVCPICATLPGGEPNQITDDFLAHLNVEHQPHIVRIRSRHHVRGLNNNRNRRSQFNSNGSASSSVARETIDPITQLLSQLTDVRRVNNNSSTSNGQNGIMQFQFDRQSTSNRLPIERIIRRHQQSSQLASSIGSSQSESTANQMPYMVLLDSTTSPSANANPLPKSTTTGGSQIKINTNYLLTNTTAPLVEADKEKIGMLKADRSIFVQEMIVASLSSEPLTVDNILSTKSATEDMKICASSDQSLDYTNEIKLATGNCNDKGMTNNEPQTAGSSPSDTNSHFNDSQTKKPGDCPLSANVKQTIKCLNENKNNNNNLNSSSLNYNEHESNVQAKSLSSLIASNPNSPYIVSQTQLSHRNRVNKGRPTSSGTLPPNIASLAIRSSLAQRQGATITVVSPTGRRKVLKHSTEPPPN
ncbi:E3 ubiquitin-protein ligase kcmf1 [Blomia tropicalis]|nr:E3 ubiquitin-protein ligase kcmf1 [Blomia tropicalis]